MVRSEPKSAQRLHVIDKAISHLSDDIAGIMSANMTPDDKWNIVKYKLAHYYDLVSKLRRPDAGVLNENEEEKEEAERLTKIEPETSQKQRSKKARSRPQVTSRYGLRSRPNSPRDLKWEQLN